MPIPTTETLLVKAEIETTVFRQAFVELAIVFHQRDRKGLAAADIAIREKLHTLSLSPFLPTATVKAGTLDIELLRETGLRDAIASYDRTIRQINRRLR